MHVLTSFLLNTLKTTRNCGLFFVGILKKVDIKKYFTKYFSLFLLFYVVMCEFLSFLNKMGNELGYPFYVFRDGSCSKSAVSVDGKDVYMLEVNKPLGENKNYSIQKMKTDNDLDFIDWNIDGKSLNELVESRNIYHSGMIFLTQSEKLLIISKGNGEALKLVLDKFLISFEFAEILFKRGLGRLVNYVIKKHGYSQNLEEPIVKYGDVSLIYTIIFEARFSKNALITLIKRELDGIILLYLRKKEERYWAKADGRFFALDDVVEIEFVKNAKTNSLCDYISRYGLIDSSVSELLYRNDTESKIAYLKKIRKDFGSNIIDKLDTLNVPKLKELYNDMFEK